MIPTLPGKDATSLTIQDVNVKGATETDTYAINDNGTITGDYIDSSGVLHGLILKERKVTTIDHPNGTLTQGFGINSKVVVVGWYVNSSGVEVGFKWAAGKFTDIVPLYLIARTLESGNYVQRLHALDITTGAERNHFSR